MLGKGYMAQTIPSSNARCMSTKLNLVDDYIFELGNVRFGRCFHATRSPIEKHVFMYLSILYNPRIDFFSLKIINVKMKN
jgi:hypothetical protein